MTSLKSLLNSSLALGLTLTACDTEIADVETGHNASALLRSSTIVATSKRDTAQGTVTFYKVLDQKGGVREVVLDADGSEITLTPEEQPSRNVEAHLLEQVQVNSGRTLLVDLSLND